MRSVGLGVCAAACVVITLATLSAPASAQGLPEGWGGAPPSSPDAEPTERPAELPEGAREVVRLPARFLVSVGFGASVRSSVDVDLQQTRWAPPFAEIGAAYIAAGENPLVRHGPTLDIATNLGADGAAIRGLLPWRQWVLSPGWLVRFVPGRALVPDWLLFVHVAVPFVVAPDRTWGLYGGAGVAYMLRAALGIYAEVGASIFVGGATRNAVVTTHPMISFELGVRFDLERL